MTHSFYIHPHIHSLSLARSPFLGFHTYCHLCYTQIFLPSLIATIYVSSSSVYLRYQLRSTSQLTLPTNQHPSLFPACNSYLVKICWPNHRLVYTWHFFPLCPFLGLMLKLSNLFDKKKKNGFMRFANDCILFFYADFTQRANIFGIWVVVLCLSFDTRFHSSSPHKVPFVNVP